MEHTLGEQARCGHSGPLAALGAEWPTRGDRGWARRGAGEEIARGGRGDKDARLEGGDLSVERRG
jgi:hypothetical protein